MPLKKPISLLLCFIAASVSPLALAASFDCQQASRRLDQMICANAELSKADSDLAAVYQQALQHVSDKTALKQAQRAWLKTRDACQESACLLQAYQARISALQKAASASAVKNASSVGNAAQAAVGTYPVWISPDLGVKSLAPADIEAALARKFWDNPVYQREFPQQTAYLKAHQNDAELPVNCLAVTTLIQKKKILNDGYNIQTNGLNDVFDADLFLPKIQADCQAIRLLAKAKPATKSAISDFIFTNKLFNYLPIMTIPDIGWCSNGTGRLNYQLGTQNYRAFKSSDKTLSWDKYLNLSDKKLWKEAKFITITPYQATFSLGNQSLNNGSDTFNFYLIAKGDFNGDGQQEILLEVTSTTGYYTNESEDKPIFFGNLFLLTRQQSGVVLEILYPERYGFIEKIKCGAGEVCAIDKNTVTPMGYLNNRVMCNAHLDWLL